MLLRPPRSTRTDTLFPDTTLFRSRSVGRCGRAVLYVLTESWVVLHGYRGKGFKYPAVDMQPFPWRQKAGRGLFHAKHPSCYGGRRDRRGLPIPAWPADDRSEEHTSELQSLMRTSFAVFCLKKKKQ